MSVRALRRLALALALAIGAGLAWPWPADLAPAGAIRGAAASTVRLASGPDLRWGLGGHWPLDDGTGTSARDVSGLGRTAVLGGSFTWGDGNVDLAPSGYVELPSSVSLAGQSAATIGAWVWVPSAAWTETKEIMAVGSGGTTGAQRLDIFLPPSRIPGTSSRDTGDTLAAAALIAVGTAALSAGPHLLVATVAAEAPGRVQRLYVDGALVASASGALGPWASTPEAYPPQIGRRRYEAINRYALIPVGGARVCVGRTLSPAAVAAWYAEGPP